MSTEKLVQNSFVNGQYDREVQSKERTDFIGQGLAKALNVVSSEKGELRKRLGTKHLLDLSSATVLVPFRMNDENDAIITIDASGSNNVKGYKYVDGGLEPLLGANPTAVTFPAGNTWNNGNDGDTDITNGDWTVGASFFRDTAGTNYPGYLLNKENPSVGEHGGGYWANATAPSWISIDNSNTDVCMTSIDIWFWTSKTGGFQYEYLSNPVIQYSDDGVTWIGVQTDYEVGQYTQVEVWQPGGPLPKSYISKCLMNIKQTKYARNHRYWRVYFMTGNCWRVYVGGMSFIDAESTTVFQKTVAYTEEQLKKIKYAQDSNEMFIACEGVIPQRLVNNAGVLTFGSFTPANTSTLWSVMSYPSAVALFQNRLWFGGFENNPQTVIASKFDDYETFTLTATNSTIQYDDYLNLRCNQLRTRISNIIGGQKVLYTFSEDGLALVDSGANGMIATNQSVEFNLRNRMPAGDSTPAFKDDIMLYGSSDGTKLYAVDYDLITERFQVDDLAKYAKDITFDKITELHYVNDESKQIYGLLESGNVFALNYQKGAYQGFFPFNIQGGYVYDIVQIKNGRGYKLLLVTFRNGNWYIEEMPDKGQYINTNAPFMTKDDKKWATYDNINNNIALDCYHKYANTIDLTATLDYENELLSTTTDLSAYIGSQVMLGQLNNESNWAILTLNSVESSNVYSVTIDASRGTDPAFDLLYVGFTTLPVTLPNGSNIGVVSQGKYMGEYVVDAGAVILPEPVFKATYGALYDSYAFIKVTRPYESMKTARQINLEVQNTMHLSVGTSLSDMQVLEDINDNTHYDLTNMTMNGGYIIVPSDTPEWEKYIILKSDKGLPFTVNAVEVIMNYSNEGGN